MLTTKFEHFKMPKEILDVVKEMFDSSPDMNKHKMLGDILNTIMSEGGSVVNHVLKLMEYI